MGFWDGVNSDDVPADLGGNYVSAEGRYHMMVSRIEEDGGKNSDAMVVDMEVQHAEAGNEGQIGRTHRERFNNPRDAADKEQREMRLKQALKFAVAVGLTTEAEIAQAKAAGRIPVVDFRSAVGRHFGCKLVLDKKQKKYLNAGFSIWPLDAPEMKGCPINQVAVSKSGDQGGDPFGKPAGNQPSAPSGSGGAAAGGADVNLDDF